VRRLVEAAPARMTLGARAGAPLVTGERSLLTPDGCCVEIYDLVTGEKRGTTADDVATISRVVDALPEIDFCWPAVSAQDRPVDARSARAVLAVANTGSTCRSDRRRAELAEWRQDGAGGERLGERFAPSHRSASARHGHPARERRGDLDAGLTSRKWHPIGSLSCRWGLTTPITMAALRRGIAEARRVRVQAACPGAPVFICFIPSVMDPKSGDFTGGARGCHGRGCWRRHTYGLPSGVNPSGAKSRAGSRRWMTPRRRTSLAAGVDMSPGWGMVSGGRIFS
jgi:hypothetical protein